MTYVPCPFGSSPELLPRLSRARRPSFPISPHVHPHSTIALHRICNPLWIAVVRRLSSSRSFIARCASHACSSVCAAPSFGPICTSGLEKLREEADPEEPRKESRECLCCLEALMRRVTLYKQAKTISKKNAREQE